MSEQMTLDIDAESFTVRERLIIQRLHEYRTIDRDIRQQERIISGELTRCNICTSFSGPSEDDPAVLAALRTQEMSEGFHYIAQSVGKAVDMSDRRYADTYTVAVRLERARSEDPVEAQALRDGHAMLTERHREDPVHLTGPERYAECRMKEVAEARAEHERLVMLKRTVSLTLEDMNEYHHEWYLILWHKYVMDEHWKEVCRIAARDGVALTDEEYRLARKKALYQFDKWAVGLC
ncbi:hypothetical protein [Alicyclobacillus fastidiosus]|uniref:Uncharacterized protein n=1 Tax=Alicyclobacillus fastidiosus TaxID=392011 RepID=A0ABV5A9V5_9BACL|nr:hypothetical protein [Alicyclobacillus fastidiosus]WEH10965.1 hypothetical protein PYS47_07045 [Alicyclobacillus fastidiosus]